MEKVKKTGAYVSLGITLFLLCTILYTLIVYQRNITTSFLCIHIAVLMICVIAFYMLSKNTLRTRLTRRHLWLFMFTMYSLFCVYLLFFSNEFARDQIHSIFETDYMSALRLQWQNSTNFIPFTSIKNMIIVLDTSAYMQYSLINLLGNFIAFMPFAFFIQMLWGSTSIRRFLLIISILIACIEVTQFLTLSGAMDIDDFILNVSGSLLFFVFLKLPKLRTYLKRMSV